MFIPIPIFFYRDKEAKESVKNEKTFNRQKKRDAKEESKRRKELRRVYQESGLFRQDNGASGFQFMVGGWSIIGQVYIPVVTEYDNGLIIAE